MSPCARWLALCLTVVVACAAAPSPSFAQTWSPPPPVTRAPRSAGLWAAVGIGAGLVVGSAVFAGFAIDTGRYGASLCDARRADGEVCDPSSAERAHERRYWQYVGSSLALGVVGLAVGTWGVVGLVKARRAQRAHAALQRFQLSLDPRAAGLAWHTRF